MKKTNQNQIYANLLRKVYHFGDKLSTRNHPVYSYVGGLQASFNSFPLITYRKTAWKKALLEMEWFLSGNPKCPEKLMDWWGTQLNPDKQYLGGYGEQLRKYSSHDGECFDQLSFVLKALREHPNSRRIITTTWNPADMSIITYLNENPLTPTTCHGTLTQFFVRNNRLNIHTYQRSADLLLGVPHNWVQYWALITFLAYHSKLEVGEMVWTFGDAHIYDHASHTSCVETILDNFSNEEYQNNFELKYNFSKQWEMVNDGVIPMFKAEDFEVVGNIPSPLLKTRPTLF